MINYTLPDFTVGLGLNLFFIRLLEQRPALFQDGVAHRQRVRLLSRVRPERRPRVLARASHASADGGGVLALGRGTA